MSTNDLSNNVTLQLGDNTSDNGQDVNNVNNVNNEQITSNLQNVFASISDTAVSVVEVNNSDSNSATIFEEKKDGTLIKDHVVYKIPFGILGDLIVGKWIRKDLQLVFNHRAKVINNIMAQ